MDLKEWKKERINALVCEVAEFAKKHRWRQGSKKTFSGQLNAQGQPIYEYCLLGMCDEVVAGEDNLNVIYDGVVDKIARALPNYERGVLPHLVLISFNDASHRKKSEVLAALDKACAAK